MASIELLGAELRQRGEVWRGTVRGAQVVAWRPYVTNPGDVEWHITARFGDVITGSGSHEDLLKAFWAACRDAEHAAAAVAEEARNARSA